MKNKRIALSILAIALVACIACVAVACNEKGNDPKTYTVTFSGESVSGISAQTVEEGACAQRPQDPQRDGYDFKGWAEEGQSELFDFATPITKDIILVAVWEESDSNKPGSKNNPYLIATADDLADFADKVNHPEEDDNEKYAKSFFKLVADIDMEGIPYVSAGQLVTLNEGEENERMVYGFSGSFDGNGHTISNLTIKRNLRSGMSYVGLFGYCHRATITNLTLDNVSYAVVSGADQSSIGAYVGGIVGYGNLTNISNVRVSGEFNMSLCASNPSRIGGIAGGLDVYDSEIAYIAYVKNCVSEVKVVAKRFEDDGSASSLDSAVNGGIIGATSTASNGALAVINCVTTANAAVEGGEWVGGIMGYASCSRMSIINCANYARVKATNKDVSYAGGIIGYSSNDNTILDCFSTGRVTATRATSTTYKSYAGGIAGYTFTDDYSGGYYDAGTVIENCFYKLSPSTTDKTNAAGTKAEEGATFDAEWIAQNVKWDMSEWTLEGGIAIPKTDTAISGTHTVSLVKGDTIIKEEVRQFNASSFAIVGKLEALSNEGNNLFFDWEFESGARYRYYVPVVKDMTFKARFGDSSKVTHVYTGKGEYHGQVDGGVLYLAPDGTLKLVNGNAIGGKYTYDGNSILLLTFYNNYGDVSGTLTEDGSIKLVFDYGMSGQVEYTYTKSDLKVFGEYYNEDGDVLTFSDGKISYQSESLKNKYGIVKSYSGTYTIDGNDITIESKWLADYFTSMSATVNEDMTLTVNFVGKNGVAGYTNAIFAQPTANYKGQPFVGTYYTPYVATTDSDKIAYAQNYEIEFREDGVVAYRSWYSETLGTYAMFKNNTLARISLEGRIGTLYFDAEKGLFYGDLHRSDSQRDALVLPASDGNVRSYLIAGDINNVVYVNDAGAYYMKDGQLQDSTQIVAPNNFANGDRVTIGGVDYRVVYTKYSNENASYKSQYILYAIGAEEGTYTYGDKTFTLDGIGGITGAKETYSAYEVYGDLVVAVFDDFSIVGFDFKAAKAANGVVTLAKADGYGGVYYQGGNINVQDKNGNVIGKEYIEKYYLLMVDGYGHSRVLYYSADNKEYRPNWSSENHNGWAQYTVTATGVHVEYNSSQVYDFVFYYDNNLLFVKCTTGVLKETTYPKVGYTGTTELPKLPASAVGSYTGTESDGTAVVLNLKQDLTGTYKGNPFVAVYDGVKNVSFTISSIKYLFDVTTNTISYGSESVSLTRVGDVTEVIPEAICGTWRGTWTSSNATSGTGNNIDLTIESDGTFVFNKDVRGIANYDAATNTVTVSCTYAEKPYVFTLKYNADTKSFGGRYETEYDGNMYYYECDSLTKVTE